MLTTSCVFLKFYRPYSLRMLNNGVCIFKVSTSFILLTIAQQWVCIFEVSTVPIFPRPNNGVCILKFLFLYSPTIAQQWSVYFLVSLSLIPPNNCTPSIVFWSFYTLIPQNRLTMAQVFLKVSLVSLSLFRIAQQWRVVLKFLYSVPILLTTAQQWHVCIFLVSTVPLSQQSLN
jgi:hypothetical protein